MVILTPGLVFATLALMPRKMRVQYAGAIYHVMSRGDRRENVFLDDVDRQDFLKTLAETCQKTGFQVHAYCLMPNHFHLVVETPDANLVAGMAWLLSTYTIRLNQRHQLSGHVFGGRYKALNVEGSGHGYLSKNGLRLRASEPGAGGNAPGRRSLGGVSVEQLGLVRGGAGTPARVDAGGPVVGRTRDRRHGPGAPGI
jgi:REP element-mobilizing transposase RayT